MLIRRSVKMLSELAAQERLVVKVEQVASVDNKGQSAHARASKNGSHQHFPQRQWAVEKVVVTTRKA